MSCLGGIGYENHRSLGKADSWIRIGGIVAFAFTLGACASVPDNPMSMQQRQAMGLSKINVEVAPEANIWWGEAERDFAASKGCHKEAIKKRAGSEVSDDISHDSEQPDCDYDALIETPEAKAYLEARAVEKMQAALEAVVKPKFAGPDSAELSVRIHNVHIVSGAQAMILGGNHILGASFKVIDPASGTSLAQYENLTVFAGYGGGGLVSIAFEATSDDPYDRLSDEYAEEVKDWLQAEES